jgi:hypothetical protein
MHQAAILAAALILGMNLKSALAEEPALPSGLGPPSAPQEPSLPSGLDLGPRETSLSPVLAPRLSDNLDLGGFFEVRYGLRTSSVGTYDDATIGEARLQLEAQWSGDRATISLTTDFVVDSLADAPDVDLESGEGWIDLREASLLLRPSDNLDVKIGRQILTWGTGDLIFINDLFPKDWNAFFIGRDDEYLKAPSDALKASFYKKGLTFDAVYTPRFDADRFLDGRRLSFFDPMTGDINLAPFPLTTEPREDYGQDWEGAMRISGQVKSFEWAGYVYKGFWKSPIGFDAAAGKNTFPELNVYGASLRGPLLGGVGHGEVGYFDVRDKDAALDPFLPNGQMRILIGFEHELKTDLTGGIQYYMERMSDFGDYRASLLPGMQDIGRTRHLTTVRLTQMAMNQNLTLSLFNFWSPSDEDGYLRLKTNYKASDALSLEAGLNLFYGEQKSSFFGQFQDNTNIYLSARMSF